MQKKSKYDLVKISKYTDRLFLFHVGFGLFIILLIIINANNYVVLNIILVFLGLINVFVINPVTLIASIVLLIKTGKNIYILSIP